MSAVENFTEPGGHLFERADHHGLSRAGRNAGRLFAFGKALGAEIALEHDAAARKLGRNVEIEAHAGLALRDVPRTHVPAFCTAEADVRVDGDGAFLRLVDGAERTELAAWCVEAVHAAARQMNVAAVDAERLDVEEVVGRETVDFVSAIGKVFELFLRPVRPNRLLRFRNAVLILLAAGGDAERNSSARTAVAEVKVDDRDELAAGPVRARSGRVRRAGQGGARQDGVPQELASLHVGASCG